MFFPLSDAKKLNLWFALFQGQRFQEADRNPAAETRRVSGEIKGGTGEVGASPPAVEDVEESTLVLGPAEVIYPSFLRPCLNWDEILI